MELRMSRKEQDRLKVIEQVELGLMSQAKASEVPRLSVRQMRRIERRYRGAMGSEGWCIGRAAAPRDVGSRRTKSATPWPEPG